MSGTNSNSAGSSSATSSSNVYGLDFLRQEHTLDEDGDPRVRSSNLSPPHPTSSALAWADGDYLAASVAHKPDLEKQFDVIHFLQAHRSSGCLAPSVIYQRTGIDLQENETVAQMLQRNPKIRVEQVPDPENPSLLIATYAYQAKYNHVRDRTTLLAQINRCKNGVARRDLEDAYEGVEKDLDDLTRAGDVVAINNTEDKDKVLFPRGEAFLVELDGIVVIPEKLQHPIGSSSNSASGAKKGVAANGNKTTSSTSTGNNKDSSPNSKTVSSSSSSLADKVVSTSNSSSMPPPENNNGGTHKEKRKRPPIYCLETDIDPTTQIRRGEAVQIGGQWFRVSSAVKDGPLRDQPARAQHPLSVVSLTDLPKRNDQDGYIRPLSEKILPLDAALSATAIENLTKAKAARDQLHKVGHGRSGGVASQLLGSHAHSSNPTTLAASFGTGNVNSRKRPNKGSSSSNTTTNDGTNEPEGDSSSGATTPALSKHNAMRQAQEAASNPQLSLYGHARRHGCTKDVRAMYLATRKHIPELEQELHALLMEHKLLEPGELMRRQRLQKKANVDNDGKPKKRRYYERKNQRMTNTHLEGTEIGAVLRRATEKQKQGESVGDGGM
jgi:TFA2 Winged helix domain 2